MAAQHYPKVDDDRVELWLWGIDQKGNRVMLVEHNFAAYFYVLLHGGANPDAVAQEIMRESAGEVAKTKVVRRRFFGKPVIAIKITCKNLIKTAQVAKELRKLDCVSDCLEDDIRAAMRYLIENSVVPCGWHEADVAEEQNPRLKSS